MEFTSSGHRSGRGIFIYPDGSYYEGCWRKNLKHGKGRYCYTNGDCYCGDWYRGLRHGIGIYSIHSSPECNSSPMRFKGTWRKGVRVGPFQLTYGNDDENCTTLHGTWDNIYPQGPAVFSFNNRYLLTGYFQTPVCETQPRSNNKFVLESLEEEENGVKPNISFDKPSLWYAQEICNYDYAMLPQEPVPLPLSDSDISICSLISETPEITVDKELICPGEEEGVAEESLECVPCECECSTSEGESTSQICSQRTGDPCAIEIRNQKCD